MSDGTNGLLPRVVKPTLHKAESEIGSQLDAVSFIQF